MIWIPVQVTFVAVVLGVLALKNIVQSRDEVITKRVHDLTKLGDSPLERRQDNRKIPALKAIKRIIDYVARVNPKKVSLSKLQATQLALYRAGNPGDLNPAEFIAIKLCLVILLSAAAGLFGVLTGKSTASVPMVGIMSVLGWWLPEVYLQRKTHFRQGMIVRSLPNVLDLLTVSVEAGLGFDAALGKVVDKFHGPISDEFRRAMQEISLGKLRREAFRDVAYRTGQEDLHAFINSLIQADQLGISIAGVLRQQSEQVRRMLKQKVEERAMKAPLLMMFPLVFFIFPALFVVLLGPAVIQVIQVFAK